MQNNVMLLLLIAGHMLGDFYFQSDDLVVKKKENCKYILFHGLIYSACICLSLLPVMSIKVFVAFLTVSVSHYLIDLLKMNINRCSKKNSVICWIKKNLFCIDQSAHIAIMIIIAIIYATRYNVALNCVGNYILQIYHEFINYSPLKVLCLVVILLIVGKPANILIKELNKKVTNKEKVSINAKKGKYFIRINIKAIQQEEVGKTEKDIIKAGRLIGILERTLVIILLIVGQYTAIGLVFAAKSLTRFDKISKDSKFAEYYLIGTLLSILIAIASFLLFWKVLST